MLKFATILLCVCLFRGVIGQSISSGKCPQVKVQDNFDIEKYVGRWYEQERLFFAFELDQKCVTAEYTLQQDGSVQVNNTGYVKLERKFSTSLGNAKAEDPKVPAKLGVKFFPEQPRGDYWVLSTDYTSYTVIWSCGPITGVDANIQLGWILTRESAGLSASKMAEIHALLDGFGIDVNKYKTTEQNCNES
ncbi:apolipoprotein D-like [Mya arenaria]|uniref:apolipoprotein D-like n=1 Tax=Mya arenaria TaxID=6604 RepID=UPI0022DF369D|nr:apolipoprotein D-like [Mya arenaria]